MQLSLHTSATSSLYSFSTQAILFFFLSFFLAHLIWQFVHLLVQTSFLSYPSFLSFALYYILHHHILLPLLQLLLILLFHFLFFFLLLLLLLPILLLILLVVLPATMDDPRQRRPDITTAKLQLDWEPRVPVRDGLAKAIEYFSKVTHRPTDLPHSYSSY